MLPNDAANGVAIPTNQHQTQWLHRGTTYDEINELLSEVETAEEAREALRKIGNNINNGKFPTGNPHSTPSSP